MENKNYKILIDCSLNYLEIAIIKDQNIIDVLHKKQDKNLTKILIESVKEILKKNHLVKNNINNLYVVSGPGSFTSIKLVAIFVNTWKMIFDNIELFEINTCLWHTIAFKTFSYLDAKSGYWYVQIIDEKINKDVFICSNAEFIKLKEKYNKLDYFFNDCNINIDIYSKWEFNKHHFSNVQQIVPKYLKKPI